MKSHITTITLVLQDCAHFFLNVISFLHIDVGKSQIEWNMKVKIEICSLYRFNAKCHSNPYIESITVDPR